MQRRHLALIAHDGKKDEMVDFVRAHRDALAAYDLIATGTTGERIAEAMGISVTRLLSGPLGGDAQIAAKTASGEVDAVIFLVDPLYAHPHEPDIRGLLRMFNVHNIPLATNLATAEIVLAQLEEGG